MNRHSEPNSSGRRASPGTIALWLLLMAGWWVATAWIGRQPSPLAIKLTNPFFAAGLAWLYVGAWGLAVTGATDPRRMRFRAVALTLSLAMAYVLVEAPAAAGLVDYSRIRGALTGRWDGPAVDFVYDREFSFRRPAHSRWSGYPRSDMAQKFNLPIRSTYLQTLSTDARGFRNATDLDRADIALVGDSYIEGAYVSDNETAAARLGALTGRTVANLGVSGYGTLQEARVIEKYGVPLAPKAIAWFFFEGNDLDDDQAFENQQAYEKGVPPPPEPPARRWRGFTGRSFTLNAFMQLRESAEPLVPNSADSFGWFREQNGTMRRLYFYDFDATREIGEYERDRFETTKATFARVNESCRRRGIRLIVFYIPMKFRVYGSLCQFPPGSPCPAWHPWDLEARFVTFVREAGIEFVSLTEPMRRAGASGELLYVAEDSHWSPAGHEFVAKTIGNLVSW